MVRIIDLTQSLVHRDKLGQHPFHPVPYIFRFITHEQSLKEMNGRTSYQTDWLNINSHSGTHVDAPLHVIAEPNTTSIEEMPLDWCYGEAVCIDISHFPPKAWISEKDLESAVKKSGIEIRRGDIVLLYTGHWNRTQGTPAYGNDNPGLTKEAMMWLKDQGIKSFGIDAVTPDNPIDQQQRGVFPCHNKESFVPHYENLANLDKVVGKRFIFVGLPLKLRDCSGSPVRAAAILDR